MRLTQRLFSLIEKAGIAGLEPVPGVRTEIVRNLYALKKSLDQMPECKYRQDVTKYTQEKLTLLNDFSVSDKDVAERSGWLCLEQLLMEVRDELGLQSYCEKWEIWSELEEPCPIKK